MESDFLARLQLAEDALGKARVSLEATRMDATKQRKRVAELRKEAEAIEKLVSRGEYARTAMKQLRGLEEEPNLSFVRKAQRVRQLVEPMTDWSAEAKALVTLIDLEIRTMS
jgi:predicted  nucleic acid-binding Zn-ribbon protein